MQQLQALLQSHQHTKCSKLSMFHSRALWPLPSPHADVECDERLSTELLFEGAAVADSTCLQVFCFPAILSALGAALQYPSRNGQRNTQQQLVLIK